MDSRQDELRKLPKIDKLIELAMSADLIGRHGREQAVEALRDAVERARETVLAGNRCPAAEDILATADEKLSAETRPTLKPVINATGVVIHTNLGRAPLSEDAIAAMTAIARGYSNLEYSLEQGERGSRYDHCGALLAKLTGAEDGIVVNNNASSVMILLAALARGREVVVSRGELVEIGGGFRIPDVMRESGAALVEVGTTNRTYVRDYEAAVTERTAAFMVVHRSNFQLSGFTHTPALDELCAAAHAKGLVVLDDLGSGTFLDTAPFGLEHEPTVQERVAAGADLVCFSGDKLLGGPQAGYIVGKKELVQRIKKFPMMRALRVDKVTLAGIEATLRHYVKGEALAKIPVWNAISAKPELLGARAQRWQQALGWAKSAVVETRSTVGGGSLPGLTLPTRALALEVEGVDEVAKRLRLGEPPLVARIEENRLVLDPRTVMPHEDEALVGALRAVLPR